MNKYTGQFKLNTYRNTFPKREFFNNTILFSAYGLFKHYSNGVRGNDYTDRNEDRYSGILFPMVYESNKRGVCTCSQSL